MSYWIHPDAELALGDAAFSFYYAEHANRLIGLAFLAEYERVVALLVENQQRGPFLARAASDLRVCHFDRFPYSVIYGEDSLLGPQIYAVAHQSRQPGYWASRA